MSAKNAGKLDVKEIINKHRLEARKQKFESGRHTWQSEAADELEDSAKVAKEKGYLDEYVESLESAAKTMRDRAQGHRGGISGRGTK